MNTILKLYSRQERKYLLRDIINGLHLMI